MYNRVKKKVLDKDFLNNKTFTIFSPKILNSGLTQTWQLIEYILIQMFPFSFSKQNNETWIICFHYQAAEYC